MKRGDTAGHCRRHRTLAPMRSRTAQVSLEYMLVVGFMFVMIAPLLYLYATARQDTVDTLADGEAQRAGAAIRDVAERVYFAGEPARETIVVTLPDEIRDARIDGTAQVYTLQGSVTYDVRVAGVAPLNGTLPKTPGRHTLSVEAINGTVSISPR